jgi:uncharacterized protein
MDYPRYDPASPVTPLRDTELDHLDELLQCLPSDGAMTLDGVDGFLTAWLVGPAALRALPTAHWLPVVWGGDGPGGMDEALPFASKRQRKDTVVLLLRHLRHLDELLTRSPDGWQPIFGIAEQGDDEWADAQDWCAGFLAAVDLLPEPWARHWLDPASAPLLALGGGLDGVPMPGEIGIADSDLDTPEAIDALSRAVPAFVLGLRAQSGLGS